MDPVQIVRRFTRADDREVVGFIAASPAFGRVATVVQSIERVLVVLGRHPAESIRRFEPKRDKPSFAHIVHRWTRGPDIAALIWIIHQMLRGSGSIEEFFVEGLEREAPDLSSAIDSFSTRALAFNLSRLRPGLKRPGVSFFSAGIDRWRLQAPEPVSTVDGAPRD